MTGTQVLSLPIGLITISSSESAPVTSGASRLLGAEANGFALSAEDDSLEIRDTITPANNYDGSAVAKFGAVRASAGLYYDEDLVIQSSASGLRRDCNPRFAGMPQFLVEEARTNIMWPSADFTHARYVPDTLTVTADAVVAPDGTTTADKLVPTATGGLPHYISQSFASATSPWTLSLFIKPGGYNKVGFRENITTGTSISFDLTGIGEVFSIFNNGVCTVTGKIFPLAGDWYRVSATFTGIVVPHFAFFVMDDAFTGGDVFTYGWLPDGTSGVYVWGSQNELNGASSSHIPTTTSEVTRAADLPKLLSTLFPYHTSLGTMYVWSTAIAHTSGYTCAIIRHTMDDEILLYNSAYLDYGAFDFRVYDEFALSVSLYSGGPAYIETIGPIDAPHRICVAWSPVSNNAACDGIIKFEDDILGAADLTVDRFCLGFAG